MSGFIKKKLHHKNVDRVLNMSGFIKKTLHHKDVDRVLIFAQVLRISGF